MVAIDVYWWRPTRPLVGALKEGVKHGSAWWHLGRRTGRISNFGDELNAHILPHVLGSTVRWSKMSDAAVVGIGSLLNEYARDGAQGLVFGSGVRDLATFDRRRVDLDRVVGVRGLLTAQALGLDASAAIGDPGLLVSDLLSGRPNTGTGPALVVPHFAAMGHSTVRNSLSRMSDRGAEIVYPTQDPIAVAREIAKSSMVFTSSLHALVFADALGIPCKLVSFGLSSEPSFKYLDYQSFYPKEFQQVPSALVEDEVTGSQYQNTVCVHRDRVTGIARAVAEVQVRLRSAGQELVGRL